MGTAGEGSDELHGGEPTYAPTDPDKVMDHTHKEKEV